MSRDGPVYFYDLPVYRIDSERFNAERDAYVDQAGTNLVIRDRLERKYGCWDFNEIVAYIRLYLDGEQVLGEYYAAFRRRAVKGRRATFEWQTHKLACEVDVEPPFGNAEILAAVREYIADCRREVPRRFVDTSAFEEIAAHVDWVAILERARP